ncbi:DUF4199 domain-containing protein [Maribacter sp. 2304DJ31-5]|uniref:DUF4199 domain-containing protein n=1 Tax=Maribacter sp. 2304DJ31-5 TaxID=3386273 RepID=UPI0039BC806F
MQNTVLKFGGYGFLLGSGLFMLGLLLMKDIDVSVGEVIGYATMIVSLSLIFFGIKHFRDKVNSGTVSLGKAITIGVLISCFPAIGIGIADFIYTSFINPDFFKEYVEMMEARGHTEPIPRWSNGMMALVMFLTVMILGFIISLISALLLQRKN